MALAANVQTMLITNSRNSLKPTYRRLKLAKCNYGCKSQRGRTAANKHYRTSGCRYTCGCGGCTATHTRHSLIGWLGQLVLYLTFGAKSTPLTHAWSKFPAENVDGKYCQNSAYPLSYTVMACHAPSATVLKVFRFKVHLR